jgi:hypothetical protein
VPQVVPVDGPSWWLVTLCSCATGCASGWAKLVACHPLLMCHRLCQWMGQVGGLSPSAHVPQVMPMDGPSWWLVTLCSCANGWAKLVACHPLLMCHRLHHLCWPSWCLVTLCSCATGCTTCVGLSPSAHVPQVAPLGWAATNTRCSRMLFSCFDLEVGSHSTIE